MEPPRQHSALVEDAARGRRSRRGVRDRLAEATGIASAFVAAAETGGQVAVATAGGDLVTGMVRWVSTDLVALGRLDGSQAVIAFAHVEAVSFEREFGWSDRQVRATRTWLDVFDGVLASAAPVTVATSSTAFTGNLKVVGADAVWMVGAERSGRPQPTAVPYESIVAVFTSSSALS